VNRAADVALAGAGLVVASPLLALSAVAIALEDGRPVLYRQERVGRNEEPFELLKLRTMVVGAETQGAGYAVDRGDARITRVGRVLRKLSLDELPQLWNVLLGQMSIVGPRPPLPAEVVGYSDEVRRRFLVKPGLTGLWQVSGRAELPWEEAVRLDLYYVENWSPSLDATILLRTLLAILRGSGAY
jgi:lipopolysaccharide/colanic/teichoic acid biosynthesis glycosyltransferase